MTAPTTGDKIVHQQHRSNFYLLKSGVKAMSLGSIVKSESHENDQVVDENEDNKGVNSFLAGMQEVDLPPMDLPQGAFSVNTGDDQFLPDGPVSLADLNSMGEENITPVSFQIKNQIQDSVEANLSEIEFEKSLNAATNAGLDGEIATQLRIFCSNGLDKKTGLLIAGYAIEGLEKKQATQLSLMGLSGRSLDEIKHQAELFIGRGNQEIMGAAHSSPLGNSSRGSDGALFFKKIGTGIGAILGAPIHIGVAGIDKVKEDITFLKNKYSTKKANLGVNQSEELSDLEDASKDVSIKTDNLKNGNAESRHADYEALKMSLSAFAESAKRKLGSVKTLDEATSLLGVIKGYKAEHQSNCAELLTPEENVGLKDFFKTLDSQIKKLYNAIKSQFISIEKINEIQSSKLKGDDSLTP